MILQGVSGAGAVTQSHTRYLLKDHLGSLQYILDAGGFVVQSLGFDPWGDRLNAFQNEGSKPWATDLYNILETTRGFTGHEMVDGLDIVHMNGRIYDSRIGRFLQADIIIDGAGNTQGYNRYSYGKNNPLNGTDPSGFGFFKEVFDDFLGLDSKDSQAIASAVAAVAVCGPASPQCYAAMAAASSFAAAKTNGASNGDALGAAMQSGVIGGVSAGAFEGVAIAFNTSAPTWARGPINAGAAGNVNVKGLVALSVAQGAAGGVLAVLQGGKFGHGFASAGFSKFASPFLPRTGIGFEGLDVGQLAAAAIIGGTASELSGGKFANGAVTAAFVNLFNQQRDVFRSDQHKRAVANAVGKSENEAVRDRRAYGVIVRQSEDGGKTYALSTAQTDVAQGYEVRAISSKVTIFGVGLFESYVDTRAPILNADSIAITVAPYTQVGDWNWLSQEYSIPVFVHSPRNHSTIMFNGVGNGQEVNFK